MASIDFIIAYKTSPLDVFFPVYVEILNCFSFKVQILYSENSCLSHLAPSYTHLSPTVSLCYLKCPLISITLDTIQFAATGTGLNCRLHQYCTHIESQIIFHYKTGKLAAIMRLKVMAS